MQWLLVHPTMTVLVTDLSINFNLDVWLAVIRDSLEGEELDVFLEAGIVPGPADHPLSVKHGVLCVRCQLILGSVT